MKSKLGEAIRRQRKKAGMSIEELAKKTKIHRTYISKIENQGFIPSDKLLERIVKELNASSLVKIYLSEKQAKILGKVKKK